MQLKIKAMSGTIDCPHCGADVTDWHVDPRGCKNIDCDECEKRFDIPSDIEIVIE